jgi:enoyl-CoA hydratase/carnithine racemase
MGMLLTGKVDQRRRGRHARLGERGRPPRRPHADAERWARTICECSPLSVQATKQCAYDGLGRPLAEAMTIRYPAGDRLFKSEDVREGPRAFAEKRKPIWQGR